jgi:hypothetical protein
MTGIILVTWSWVRIRIERSIQHHRTELVKDIEAIRSKPTRLAPMREPILKEDATAHYAEALRVYKSVLQKLPASRHGMAPLKAEEVPAFRELVAPMAGALERAQRSQTLEFPDQYEGSGHDWMNDLIAVTSCLSALTKGLHARGDDDTAGEFLGLILGTAADLRSRADFGRAKISNVIEWIALEDLRLIANDHSFTAAGLRRFRSEIERVISSRLPIRHVLTSQWISTRGITLGNLSEGKSSGWEEYRSWRTLYSVRLKQVSGLDRIKALSDQAMELDRLPSMEWREWVERMMEVHQLKDLGYAGTEFQEVVAKEVTMLEELSLVRVALAALQYEVEKGTALDSLDRLVPEYLPTVPVGVANGKPLKCEAGILRAPNVFVKPWTLRRRQSK